MTLCAYPNRGTTFARTIDPIRSGLAGAVVAAVLSAPALGQSVFPSIFVANDGNLEGSVSSLQVNGDGSLTLVDRLVTGMRASGSDPCPGCNAYEISITPSGRYLATSHAPGDDPTHQITIIEVASDATLSQVFTFMVPSSPLDLEWITDEYLAVTHTSLSGTNEVRVYDVDPGAPSATLVDAEPTGLFSAYLAIDPLGRYLYAQDSSADTVTSFAINPDGSLDHIQTFATGGVYPLGLGVSPDGKALYAGGGISAGGHAVLGIRIDTTTGMLSALPGSPYTSPGASPKQVVVAPGGDYALVAHGTDATVRSFFVDSLSGSLSPTGFLFDVGLQGSLGDVAVMGDLVFFTDNTTALDGVMGVYSFTLNGNGSLTENGTIVDDEGIAPRAVAVWSPPACPADIDGDGDVGFSDLVSVLSQWGPCMGCPEDLNGDGVVGFDDLLTILSSWGPCGG